MIIFRDVRRPLSIAASVLRSALAVLPLGLALSGAASGAEPSAPGGLRYSIYSDTAAEIFWSRATDDDGIVLAYEVRFDDEVVATRDALSHFSDALEPGRTYEVSVVSIDDEGERSAPASLSVVGGDRSAPATPGPVIDPPAGIVAAPTGLLASVYSATAAEIAWDRAPGFGLTHEIRRDGVLVRTTGGVSHFDDDLDPGTSYAYEVVAIDPLGRRSAPAAVTLLTRGASGRAPPGGTPPASGPVAAPTGLVASVYSRTAAEIAWDRPDALGLTYEIRRDGELVRTTDGVSHFDDTLSPATAYTYEVVAVAPGGQRSAPSGLMLDTPGAGGGGAAPGPGDGDPPGPDDGATPGGGSGAELLASAEAPAILEPPDLYTRDGYGALDVIRADLRTATTPGTCTAEDQSGCTLDDVIADVDKTDDLTVDIPVHFSADDFADDGTVANAELRLRGGGSRFAPQKSFRVKLDSKEALWRGERHLQLNKHPFESSRIRNKLAMDTMGEIPHLPSLRTQFVNLWIDDGAGPEDYGLFTHVERLNQYFLRKRGWDEDGNIYKAEDFRFDRDDLADVAVDAEGEPLDEDRFESTLEIENGEDHRTLVAMLAALNDPGRSFESVLDRYFDRANVLAWVAANILLHQADAVRHNYLLYNPVGSERFYFLPWDYDAAMGRWREPPNDRENDSLRQRVEYGYAVASRNVFLESYYRLPGIHDRIVEAVDYLRQNHVTDASMRERAEARIALVAPFQAREPDRVNNPGFSTASAERLATAPADNARALRTGFRMLMAPVLEEPRLEGDAWRFAWRPAHDPTATSGGITYELQIARTPLFEPDDVVVEIGAIEDAAGTVERRVDAARLPAGEYYARLFATPANEPERFWQVSGNKLYIGDQTFYGPVRFRAP